MFPDPQDDPTCFRQNGRLFDVAFPGPADLRFPEVAIRDRHLAMLGAPVPKAAVDEHDDLPTGEDDVWPDPLAANHQGKILPESESGAVQGSAERHLRTRVATPIRPHRR